MACTVPWPIRGWFTRRFKDLCDEHDAAYVRRIWWMKVDSDFKIAWELSKRGYPILAYLSVPYLGTLGTLYWLWKKYI